MIPELGCPVANGLPPCVAFCGGGWPGTLSTHAQLTRALARGKLVIERLGCGVLQEQVRAYLEGGAMDE
jgi:hypothetical protein